MQFDPESYPVADYKFNATSTLGIIAREYEVTQLVQLLQTMSQDSPLYPLLIESVIDNMNLSNREELKAQLQQAGEPSPEEQQAQEEVQQIQLDLQRSQTAALQGQAAETQARAQKLTVESKMAPMELEIDRIKAVTSNLREGTADDKEFERRMKIAETLIKEKEVEGKVAQIRPPVQQQREEQ